MRIHFIGIGGIGMSSLAQYYLSKGHEVLGSDLESSEITEMLKDRGVKIHTGSHLPDNIKPDFDLVVYSPAVKEENPEMEKARSYDIRCLSYPEALGELTKNHFTIAVAGSHGKSTTTALISLIMEKAGLDPTVIVGTKLKEFGDSNFKSGKSSFLVIEACEYDGSFLNYSPKAVVITNIDKEHMDYFKTFANVKKTFKDFILKIPEDGFLVINGDDKNAPKLGKPNFGVVRYSAKQKEVKKLKRILKIPGQHNIYNSLAALSVSRILGVKDETSFKALAEYRGSWRRFEIKKAELESKTGKKRHKITIISDYGHHPNEVLTTLRAAREKYKNKKIWLIFQPHQYQRTHYLFNDFIKVFKLAPIDQMIITDIYDVAGREEKSISSKTSSENLVKKIKKDNVRYVNVSDAEKIVKEDMKSGEVLIIMGAGNIYKLAYNF